MVKTIPGILFSIKPNYVYDIVTGRKKTEIRTRDIDKSILPQTCFIYCCKTNQYALVRDDQGRFLINMDYTYKGKKIEGTILNGKVVGQFTLKESTPFTRKSFANQGVSWLLTSTSKLSKDELCEYIGDKTGFALSIDDLVIYDKPLSLSTFYKKGFAYACNIRNKIKPVNKKLDKIAKELYIKSMVSEYQLTRAPQSYQFVELLEGSIKL